MRLIMLAATAALLPATAALADDAAPTQEGSGTFTVRLKAGQDYMLSAAGETPGKIVTLTAPGGAMLASVVTVNPDFEPGVDFRAPYSATYTVHAPADANVFVGPDCRGARNTLCHIAVNHTKRSLFSASFDSDWWATELFRGHRYVATCTAYLGATLRVRDARGRVLAQTEAQPGPVDLAFRPPARGRYFLEVQYDDAYGEGPPSYTLSLR